MDVQPIVLAHNNKVVYIEENTANVQNKFSCFNIAKLKRPIEVNYLLNKIFPSSERDYYNLEVSDYDGKSAKVKFNFTDRTHTDLIQHLRNSAAKFLDISENGLDDWLASDTVTFKTIYQNIDTAAIQQLRADEVLSSNNVIPTSSTTQTDLNLYPIIDVEAIERELSELSEKISSKTTLKDYELERLFHNTFRRRDMTVTITDLSAECFSQISSLVAFIGSATPNSVIEDTLMMDSNMIVHNFAKILYKYAESFINSYGSGFVRNYKFGIILILWNLINVIHSIDQAYQVLIDSGDEFKKIFQSHKSDFMSYLSIMDKILMNLLIILYDVIDDEKYEKLQQRLEHFVDAAEDLMKLIMIINDECNRELEKLEDQKKDLSCKIRNVALTIGAIAVIAAGGYMYYKMSSENKYIKRSFGNKNNKKYEKWITLGVSTALTGTSGYVMYNAYSTKSKLENSIQKLIDILEQLRSTYKELKNWKILGKKYIQKDIDDMNNNRMNLIDEFVRIRNQCKCLGDIFDSLDDKK